MTSDDEILAALTQLRSHDLPTHGGRTLAYVYDSGVPGLDALAAAAYSGSAHANALDPTAFPSLPAMESDIVASAAALLGGGPDTVGAVTSGGTESCLLAVLAARDGAPHIRNPRMVLPSTVHAAFRKAEHYFGVVADVVDVDQVTFRADPGAVAAAIGPDTVLVVASAPSYAHGVIDPVPQIAAAAAAAGVRCHVDACIGGWILGTWQRLSAELGRTIPPFDLSVPGVTSLSVDLHKYAYTPKGASVLLHANAALRASQYFVTTDWPGYAMLNTTMQSTRSGGPIAAAWAVLSRLGGAGYDELGRRTAAAVDAVRAGVEAIDGLVVLGEPDATLIALAADPAGPTDPAGPAGPDVFVIADEMAQRGYYVQPQFSYRGAPASVHLTITAANADHTDELVGALADAAAAARSLGPITFPPEILEALATADPADLSDPATLGAMGGALGLSVDDGRITLPQRMAPINTVLNALPSAAREALLRSVLSMLTGPGNNLLAG